MATLEQLTAMDRYLSGEPLPHTQPGPLPSHEPASSQFSPPADGFRTTIEGDLASGHFSMHFRPADEADARSEAGRAAPAGPREPGPEERSIAAKVLALLKALDPDKRLRKAQPLKVFLLRYGQNLSHREIARTCECHKSLVALRLRAIKDKLPWEPRLLRELSALVEEMEAALEDSRARRIYRKGAVYGEEDDGENSD